MNLDLDDNQLTLVVNALAQRPWGEVRELMNSIERQVVKQQQQPLQAVQPAAEHT